MRYRREEFQIRKSGWIHAGSVGRVWSGGG